ncbi:MAG TPA: phenylalanine--tRNA ligase beta subunit-related protein, partial [Candidatus Acidoferrales bacterium]|nr:phenylalanine--tRNA ligase beta subunit-related protein [Candidatus Acidoferrales bacterium]
MKVLYTWLKDFVETSASPAELKDRLSMAGLAVDAVEDSAAGPLLDFDLTTNRADCLGHYGIAREVAALDRTRPKPPAPKLKEAAATVARATRVEIECPDLCGRFTARVIRGVRVGPSPDWLQQRLVALGHTPINNVVDASNYVMYELGHPLHAFDVDTLAEQRIVVRRPRQGETIRTLDNLDRKLTADMCVICDARRPVGIGGIMG